MTGARERRCTLRAPAPRTLARPHVRMSNVPLGCVSDRRRHIRGDVHLHTKVRRLSQWAQCTHFQRVHALLHVHTSSGCGIPRKPGSGAQLVRLVIYGTPYNTAAVYTRIIPVYYGPPAVRLLYTAIYGSVPLRVVVVTFRAVLLKIYWSACMRRESPSFTRRALSSMRSSLPHSICSSRHRREQLARAWPQR